MEIWLKAQDGVTIFMGIVVGALPFVLLGVLLSAFLAHYVREERLLALFPRSRFWAVLTACFIGFLFPVCECGNVPVARRLIRKGVPVYAAMAFLLAAPVINPVTIFSTWAAFSFFPAMVWWRVGLTLLIAMTVGLIFSYHPEQSVLLADSGKKHCGNDHCDHHCEDILSLSKSRVPANEKWRRFGGFVVAIAGEFVEMLSALVMGALFAAAIQVFLPREVIVSLGQGQFLSILSMIFLAVVISVCSSVDAFIALSYAGTFTMGSILAFLVFGPMIDLKSIWMLKTIFNWKTLWQMIGIILLLTILFATIYNLYLG